MTTGERIRKYRKIAGITQKELGDRCGMKSSMIQSYESNRRNPKIENIRKIADALSISESLLAKEKEEREMQVVNTTKVLYLCNGKRCAQCPTPVDGLCHHTSDKKYAKYKDDNRREFERCGLILLEKERETK